MPLNRLMITCIMYTYSRMTLLTLRYTLLKHQNKVPVSVFNCLKELSICRSFPTKRGTQGFGRQKIPVLITDAINHKKRFFFPPRNLSNLHPVTIINTGYFRPHKCQGETKLSFLNIRSACNKDSVIRDYVVENDLDMLALTETWLNKTMQNRVSASMTPDGYSIICQNREKGRSGGIVLIHRSTLKCPHPNCSAHLDLLNAW